MRRLVRGFAQRASLIAFGLVLTLLLLGAAELLLRASGIGEGARRRDPFAGFSSLVPMFEPATSSDGEPVMRTAEARRPRVPAEFAAEKPPGAFRAFVVGGSSAAGTPYGYDFAFSRWLEDRLRAALPARPVEVVNAALDAYASRRVLAVVEELTAYEPDLLVVYAGHNELAEARYYRHLTDLDPRLFRAWVWLAGTRLYGVLAEIAAGVRGSDPADGTHVEFDDRRNATEYFAAARDHALGDFSSARELEYREMHYRANLAAMIEAMRDVGARTLLVTLSQNFADWPPGASSHRADLTNAERTRFAELESRGASAARRRDCTAAQESWAEALAIDSEHAALHFAIAGCARELGQPALAARHYRLASDLDRVPNGAPTRYNEIARELAVEYGALLVDVEQEIQRAATNGLVGDEWFLDLVHPDLGAHQQIARAIADTLRATGIPAPASDWGDGYRDPDPNRLRDDMPSLSVQEHTMRGAACLLMGRRECALAAADAILAIEPDNATGTRIRNGALALRGGDAGS